MVEFIPAASWPPNGFSARKMALRPGIYGVECESWEGMSSWKSKGKDGDEILIFSSIEKKNIGINFSIY